MQNQVDEKTCRAGAPVMYSGAALGRIRSTVGLIANEDWQAEAPKRNVIRLGSTDSKQG